ncbi:unnamed protein product, partial [marine sediment metagenome]
LCLQTGGAPKILPLFSVLVHGTSILVMAIALRFTRAKFSADSTGDTLLRVNEARLLKQVNFKIADSAAYSHYF